MRGLAVLAGATAAWVAVVGIPDVVLGRSLPRVRPRVLGLGIATGAATWVIVLVSFSLPALAAALAVLAGCVPIARARHSDRLDEERVRRAWPDILLRIRSSLAAGVTVADATVAALEAAGEPFSAVAVGIRREVMFGRGFAAGSLVARNSLNDAISDRVFTTLESASRAGGHRVGEIVAALARSVGDEVRLYAAHDAAMAEQRMTVNVALVAPWGLLLLALATNPQARLAFEGRGGATLIAGGLVATSIGWVLSMRAARLSAIPRVFE